MSYEDQGSNVDKQTITERFAFEMAKKDGEIARLTTQLAAARAEVTRLLALCGP